MRLLLVGLLGRVLLVLLVRVGVLRRLVLLRLLVRPGVPLPVQLRRLSLAAVRLVLSLRGRQRLGMLLRRLLLLVGLRVAVRPRRLPTRYRSARYLPARLLRRVGLRSPGLTPRLPARGHGLSGRLPGALVGRAAGGRPRDPGGAAVRGQHDTFVRGPSSGELLLAALSALRHRDSYVSTNGIVGSRYRVVARLRQACGPPHHPFTGG